MAQINKDLYLQISVYYGYIYDSLNGIYEEALSSTYKIVDVSSSTYKPAPEETNPVNNNASVDITLSLLSIFNSSANGVRNLSTSIESVLYAVRTLNNYVILNYSDYPSGYASDSDEKLAEFINSLSTPVSLGWKELSQNAGYDTTLWTNVDEENPSEEEEINLLPYTVAQYKMNDDDDNKDIIDSIGDYHGTAQQNTSVIGGQDGITGYSIIFNGESDFISAIGPYFGGNSFSVSLWFKSNNMESNSAGRLIGTAWDDGGYPQTFYGWNIDIDYYGDQYYLFFTINGMDHINLTTGSLNDLIADWIFVTCIFDSINEYCHIYVNGELSYSLDVSSYLSEINWDSESQSLRIGSTTNNLLFFKGYIDNICIFNKVLSQEEISFLYNDGNGTESLSN